MGQSQSTRNGRRNTDNNNRMRSGDAAERTSDAANAQVSAAPSTSTNAQSPPVAEEPRVKSRSISQSFRRSVIGLVKPSTSHDEDEDGSRQQQKKWRRSRRWSKAPLSGLHGESSEATENGVARSQAAEASGSAEVDENQRQTTATSSASANPPSLTNEMSNREESSISGGLNPENSTSVGPDTNAAAAVEPTSTSGSPPAVQPEAPVPPPLTATRPEPIPPRTQSQSNPGPPPVAQFPPAGTLVVVQGVVHTSDTDRTPRPLPQPQPRPRSRTPVSTRRSNLLSGLLRRGNSTSSLSTPSPRDSILDSASTHSGQGTRTPSEDNGASDGTASGDSVTNNASDASATPQTSSSVHALNESSPAAQGPAPDNLDSQRNALSSNSLDVLGALLSVATAATAASLLSAPTSRSPSGGTEPNQAQSQEAQNAIPALARALANANPAAAAALLQRDSPTDREEQERNRVRHLWENLRQRLVNSRARSSPSGAPTPAGAEAAPGRPGGEHAIPDALFSELARAFNLNHPHDDMQADEPFEDQLQRVESGEPPLLEEEPRTMEEAPPGSFERFLVDLQLDLRTALSRNEGEGEAPTGAPASEPTSVPTIVVDAPATPESESAPQPESERPTGETVLDISGSAQQGSTEPNNTESSESAARRAETEPLLAGNEPNASSSSNEGGSSTTSLPLPPLSSASAVAAGAGQGTGANNQRANTQRAGISWWRTYRFPPMRLNPPRPPTTTSQPANPSTPTASPETTATPENTTPSTPQSVSAPTTSEPPHEHVVVPVIVVGLQSINSSRTRPNATQRTTPSAPQQTSSQPESETVPSTPTTAQQEGWRSRAARAFGRRSASADPPAPETRREPTETPNQNGSRTFFIYVFGGYYPPNHHMVTGSGNLDSFEALWELAELLGPAKPPVATESEIEKSGLEVFKAKLVTDYEKAGRVSNNCVDKCLICLDEYEDEDDVRLLSCKHAFHKGCVDHWLKTGRNNCPACRGAGVKTGDETSGTSSTTATPTA